MAESLYGLPAEEFSAARDAKVSEAKSVGDRELAGQLKQLRRPTAGAWLVNILVRDRPELVSDLVDLGAEMREAQESLAGDDLRRLFQKRRSLVDSLCSEAIVVATERGSRPARSALQELTETLESAIADPTAAEAVMSGRLTTALRYSGFGPSLGGTAATSTDRRAERNRSNAKATPVAPASGTGSETGKEDGADHTQSSRIQARRERERRELEHDVELERELAARELEVGGRRKDLQAAHKDLDESRTRLDAAQDEIRSLRDQIRAAQRSVKDAERCLAKAETRLREAADRVQKLKGTG